MPLLCENLILKIAQYDDWSGIYFTRKLVCEVVEWKAAE